MGNVWIGNIRDEAFIQNQSNIPYPPDFHTFNSTFQVLLVLCWAHLTKCTNDQKAYLSKHPIPSPSEFNLSQGIHFVKVPFDQSYVQPRAVLIDENKFPTTIGVSNGVITTAWPDSSKGTTTAVVEEHEMAKITTILPESSTVLVTIQDEHLNITSLITTTTPDSSAVTDGEDNLFEVAENLTRLLNTFALNLLSSLLKQLQVASQESDPPDFVYQANISISNDSSTNNASLHGIDDKNGLIKKFPPIKSLAFSPTSLATLLVLAYIGSEGDTKNEIAQVLGIPKDYIGGDNGIGRNRYLEGFSVFLSGLNAGRSRSNKFYNAQRVLLYSGYFNKDNDEKSERKVNLHKPTVLHKRFSFRKNRSAIFNPDYVNRLKNDFGAEISAANFAEGIQEAEELCQKVNEWVSDKTSGHIKQVLKATDINSLTRMILLDATYFHGEWASAFVPRHTSLKDFFIKPNVTVSVEMMKRKGKYKIGYLANSHSQYIELPFKDSEFSLYLLLPYEEFDLSKVSQNFDEFELSKMIAKSPTFDVKIQIPKFSIKAGIDMKSPLQNLGLVTLFDRSQANLPYILINSTEQLYVSNFKHTVSFDVDEKGAKGAATSLVVIESRRSPVEDEFIADRPFLFFLMDNRVSAITFAGIFNGPTS